MLATRKSITQYTGVVIINQLYKKYAINRWGRFV